MIMKKIALVACALVGSAILTACRTTPEPARLKVAAPPPPPSPVYESVRRFINPESIEDLSCVLDEKTELDICLQRSRAAYAQCAAKSNVLDDDEVLAENKRYDADFKEYLSCAKDARDHVDADLALEYEDAYETYERKLEAYETERSKRDETGIPTEGKGSGLMAALIIATEVLAPTIEPKEPQLSDFVNSRRREAYLDKLCNKPDKASYEEVKEARSDVCGNPEGTCRATYADAFVGCGGTITVEEECVRNCS